jgi:hypothetical protein
MDEFFETVLRIRQPLNNVIISENAFIEEISIVNQTGFVTISYGVMDEFNIINMNLVTLIVSQNTTIRDQFGQRLYLRNLREGMTIHAEFSVSMTKSNPPHSIAFRIIVINDNDATNVTVGRILSIDTYYGFLYTGNSNDINSQMRFVVTDSTIIMNRSGNRIRLRNLRPGQSVRVEHANFQTMSIPPQTTAFSIQVI